MSDNKDRLANHCQRMRADGSGLVWLSAPASSSEAKAWRDFLAAYWSVSGDPEILAMYRLFCPVVDVTAGAAVSAGLSMLQLRRYWLCMVGNIVFMLLWVTIPIGIWSLWALRKPGIRSAFRLNEALSHEESIVDLDRV